MLKRLIVLCLTLLLALPSTVLAQARTGSVTTFGGRLAYTESGSGPAVVLLHGWPVDRRLWDRVAPMLVEHGLTVVALDLPGLGDSDFPIDGDYHKVATADRIDQAMKRLGHSQYMVVGHDIGGMIAYALAARHPDAVTRLVLSEFWMPGFGLEEGMDVARGGSFHFGLHMKAEIATELTRGKEGYYLSKQAFTGMSPSDQALFIASYQRPGRMRAGFDHYTTLLEDGVAFRSLATQKLRMPILVMGGAQSFPVEKLASGVRAVAAGNFKTVVIPNAHHWLWLEQPRASADALAAFLVPTSKVAVGK